MKTMKHWRIVLAMLAALSLTSCSSNDNFEKRLTNEQKENYGQNISGEYPGQYIIVYKNKDCREWTDEQGKHMHEAHEEAFNGVQMDMSDYKMQHVFFQDFPVSLISKVIDADEELSHALANTPPLAITARYGFEYDTDNEHIKWAFIPNIMNVHLNYNGADHYIRIEFNNNSQYYKFTEKELKQPKALSSLMGYGINLQLKAIYDGSTLIQRFGLADGNYMHIKFKK